MHPIAARDRLCRAADRKAVLHDRLARLVRAQCDLVPRWHVLPRRDALAIDDDRITGIERPNRYDNRVGRMDPYRQRRRPALFPLRRIDRAGTRRRHLTAPAVTTSAASRRRDVPSSLYVSFTRSYVRARAISCASFMSMMCR